MNMGLPPPGLEKALLFFIPLKGFTEGEKTWQPGQRPHKGPGQESLIFKTR